MESKPISVLLVDDESDFTQPMAFWLNSKGYSVNVAYDGESAVKQAKENPPDIIFLDLNMPVMDGLETIKEIRKFNKDLPVIIISAYVQDQRIRQANDYGISGVFYKGKNFTEGLLLLETALKTHKQLKKE
ncbi:MAG: response regulator [Candidatus Omnitrophica bacterium]|nr:response regulator [Candidatus Omnitrophota bacterium]